MADGTAHYAEKVGDTQQIGHYIHWKTGIFFGIVKWEEFYKHQSEPITEAKEVTILRNFTIQTE